MCEVVAVGDVPAVAVYHPMVIAKAASHNQGCFHERHKCPRNDHGCNSDFDWDHVCG